MERSGPKRRLLKWWGLLQMVHVNGFDMEGRGIDCHRICIDLFTRWGFLLVSIIELVEKIRNSSTFSCRELFRGALWSEKEQHFFFVGENNR